MLTLIFLAVPMALGVYNLLIHLLGIPPISSIRAIAKLTGNTAGIKERMIRKIAHYIEPMTAHLFSPYKKEQISKKLKSAGSPVTPETFISLAAANSCLLIMVGILLLPAFPPVGPICTGVFTLLAVHLFFKKMKVPSAELRKKEIESEAPRFTSYIKQSMKQQSDLLSMFEGYRPFPGRAFGQELGIVITDIKTKNLETALIGWESRISSTLISDLSRGLITFSRGEDMSNYFDNLEARMDEKEISSLKIEASGRPRKLTPAAWFIVGCVLFTYMVVLGTQIISMIKGMTF